MKYQVALVTGASSGIGKAIATSLASKGLKLVLLARRQDRLEELAATLSEKTKCHILCCDINDHDNLESSIASLPDEFRCIDVLVNNAGLSLGLDLAPKAQWEDWQTMVHTNCLSLAKLTNIILPSMVERNCGHIINISSVAGTYAYPGGNVYGASKAFVTQFSLNLIADLVSTAVRVTNIEPGMVGGAEFSLVRFKGDEALADDVYRGAEHLQPQDIAASVEWVVSLPPHVNINRLEVMPVCQASAGFAVHRK